MRRSWRRSCDRKRHAGVGRACSTRLPICVRCSVSSPIAAMSTAGWTPGSTRHGCTAESSFPVRSPGRPCGHSWPPSPQSVSTTPVPQPATGRIAPWLPQRPLPTPKPLRSASRPLCSPCYTPSRLVPMHARGPRATPRLRFLTHPDLSGPSRPLRTQSAPVTPATRLARRHFALYDELL
jgi:hypothetical protein